MGADHHTSELTEVVMVVGMSVGDVQIQIYEKVVAPEYSDNVLSCVCELVVVVSEVVV